MSTQQTIDTGQVTGRRELHFENLSEMQAEVEKLSAAERAGTLKRTGNWTLGQAFGHLAGWINYSFDGYPMKVPFFIKMILRPMKGRFLKGPIPAGKSLPGVPDGTFSVDALSLDEGLRRIVVAIARLKASSPAEPNPIFGPLTHEQWIAMTLRHAELHLSFFSAD